MQIIKQTNRQECGVCVLTMLTNYHHKKKFSKENVLAVSHLSEQGMSLLDLEESGNKLGLEIESYETTWTELFTLPKKQTMILLINNDE